MFHRGAVHQHDGLWFALVERSVSLCVEFPQASKDVIGNLDTDGIADPGRDVEIVDRLGA